MPLPDDQKLDLNKVARGLDPSRMVEVADFIGYLKAKQEREQGYPIDEESRAWLDADLSRLGEYEAPEQDDDPHEGKPIRWDSTRNAFVAEG